MKFFRPNSNSIEVDSGIYSANDVNIHLCFNRAKRSDPMMLIDKMMQRLDSLDLNISIALGNILSEKTRSEALRKLLNHVKGKLKIEMLD